MSDNRKDDTALPRVVPVEQDLPDEFRDRYIYVKTAAQAAGVSENTIKRHLRNDWLAGMKIAPRLWLVQRHTEYDEHGRPVDPPGIDYWEPGEPGNPDWRND